MRFPLNVLKAECAITTAQLSRGAHAAADSHLGRNALDAVELKNMGVNYVREYMPSNARMYYAINAT